MLNVARSSQDFAFEIRFRLHEAGHCEVAHHFGVQAVSSIWPNVEWSPADWVKQSAWRGQTQHFTTMPRDVRRIVGIAGVVTKGLCDPDDDELDLSEAAAMSPTDWEAVGCDPGEPDRLSFQAFERAKSLLCRGGPLWPKLIQTTREIILCAPPVDFLNAVFPDWKTAYRRILKADQNPHLRWGTRVGFLLEAEPNLVAGLG
jgi:hypothetical protein